MHHHHFTLDTGYLKGTNPGVEVLKLSFSLPPASDDPVDHVSAVCLGPNEPRHDRVLLVWYKIQGRNSILRIHYLFALHINTVKHSDTLI